jgi:hypothetical protein
VNFLAWKHRHESPIIAVTSASISTESVADVVMIPRCKWDADTGVTNLSVEAVTAASLFFASSNFCNNKDYLVSLSIAGTPLATLSMFRFHRSICNVHNSALLSLTAEDFATELLRREKHHTCVFVSLTGLRSAAHLNGREGVLQGQDPNNSERFTMRLGDGKVVSVRFEHYELVQRPKLFVDEF